MCVTLNHTSKLLPLNYGLKRVHMATVGDLLLLLTTYNEPSHKHPHQVHANLSTEHRQLLDSLVLKLNRYSDAKVTTSSFIRLLILFSID